MKNIVTHFLSRKTTFWLSLNLTLMLFIGVGNLKADITFKDYHVKFLEMSKDNDTQSHYGKWFININVLAQDWDGSNDELDIFRLYFLNHDNVWQKVFDGDYDDGDKWDCHWKDDHWVEHNSGWNGDWYNGDRYVGLRFYPEDGYFGNYVVFKAEVDWDIDSDQTNSGIDNTFYYYYQRDEIVEYKWTDISTHSYSSENHQFEQSFLVADMPGYALGFTSTYLRRNELDAIDIKYQDIDGNWVTIFSGDCDDNATKTTIEDVTKHSSVDYSNWSWGHRYFAKVIWNIPESERGRRLEIHNGYKWDWWANQVNTDATKYETIFIQTYTANYEPTAVSLVQDPCSEQPTITYTWSLPNARSVDYFEVRRHDNSSITSLDNHITIASIYDFDEEGKQFSFTNSMDPSVDQSTTNSFLLEEGKQYTYWVDVYYKDGRGKTSNWGPTSFQADVISIDPVVSSFVFTKEVVGETRNLSVDWSFANCSHSSIDKIYLESKNQSNDSSIVATFSDNTTVSYEEEVTEEVAGSIDYRLAFDLFTGRKTYTPWESVDYDFIISYHNVGTTNHEDNLTIYTVKTSDVILETPNDSNGYTFLGWYEDAAFTQAVSEIAIPLGSTGSRVYWAKWERDPFAAFGEHKSPVKFKLSNDADSLTMTIFKGNFSNPDTSLTLLDMRLCYYDAQTDSEVDLINTVLDNGANTSEILAATIETQGSVYGGGNDFAVYKWEIDRSKYGITDLVDFRFYANWRIQENENVKIDASSHAPLTIAHRAFEMPESFYEGVPFKLNTEFTEGVSSWQWSLQGKSSVEAQNPQFVYASTGSYDCSVRINFEDGSYSDFILSDIVVEDLPELSIEDDFVAQAYNGAYYNFDINGAGSIGQLEFIVDSGMPWGTYLDDETGEMEWKTTRTGVYNIRIKVIDNYDGFAREVTKDYPLTIIPNTTIVVSDTVYQGFPFELAKESDYDADMWLWQMEDKEDVYSLYTQRYSIDTPGTYDFALTPADKEGTSAYQLLNVYKEEIEIVVAAIPDGYMQVTDTLSQSHMVLDAFDPFKVDFSTNMPIGYATMTISGLPTEASFNTMSGILRWDRVLPGDYAMTVTAHRVGSQEIATRAITLHVNAETYSDVTLHLVDDKGANLENAEIVVGASVFYTDANGIVVLSLMDNNNYDLTVTYGEYVPVTKSIFVDGEQPVDMVLESTLLILQNVKFSAGNIKNKKRNIILADSVMINDMILFEGDDTVYIDRSSDVMPIIITKNKVKFVGESSSKYIINNTNEKRFYLYQGLLIPDNGSTFDLGEVGSIPFDGHMMSFFADQNADGEVEEFGVEFAVFPRLPWIIGDYVTGAGYTMRSLVLDLLRAGNFDVNDLFEANEGDIAYSPRDSTRKTPGDKAKVENAAYPDSSMTSILSRIKALPVGMPSIEVVKRFGYSEGESHSIAMSDLSICYKALGFEGLGVTYEYNKQSNKITWGASAYLKFGAKCKKSSTKTTRDGEVVSYGEIEYLLESSFADYPEIEEVDIELVDEQGEVVYESSYGEFVDISDEIIEGEYDLENRLLKGIGVEILIIDGQLDKILLSADVTIPMGPVTIKNINGGIEGLTPDKDLTLTFGATMTMTGNPFIKFKDLTATVTPWSYYGFTGKLELYKSELFYADLSYDDNRKQFYVGGQIIPAATKGVITGSVELGLGAQGIGGNARCNVKTPSELPFGFGWAANRVVGSAAVGFSDRFIGARVKIGKEVEIEVREQVRWSVGGFVKSAYNGVKKGVVSLVRFVTKIVKSVINFDLSIGYDFQRDEVLFGDNVRIPSAIRMCYRGDTLVQDFVVSDPVKFLYVTSTADTGFVRFDIFDPNDKLVRSEVIWCRDSSNNEIMAVVMYPEIGTWRVKADTSGYSDVLISSMYMDSEPQGQFESPLVADTTSTQVLVRFNDINDTLDVGIFIDNDRDGYNGSLLKELKVLNKASLKFTYAPKALDPGQYYFYYTVTDRSGVPSYKYADGSLVILPSNEAIPVSVKSSSEEDVLTITWEAVDAEKVDYVSIELTDMKTGVSFVKDVWDSSFVAFDSLLMSHTYEYAVSNRSADYGISEVVKGEVFIFSTIVNNPPKWNMAERAFYSMYELDTFSLTIDVEDPEGEDITIVNITEPLPKSFELIDGEITWVPDVDERGIYEFEFVASDGLLFDTLIAVFEVKSQIASNVTIDFASTKLYEEDNMFLILNDADSEDSLKVAWLYNVSKDDSIPVEMVRSDEETYMGHFQLSYQRRSILPVSDGDTLIAKYADLNDTTYAIAFFDSLPQLADNIAPDAITDLKVTNMGDFVAVSFTVPWDVMDNGLKTNPFYYDLRYSYGELNNEEQYLGSFSIESYDAGLPGERDTIFFEMADLLDYEDSHRVWFNVKAGDPNYNVSDMSNTVVLDYVIQPTNLVAELQTSLKAVNLTWEGPEKLAGDDFLLNYEVYRKFGAEDYELIGYAVTTDFEDDFTNPINDGMIKYAVRAVYTTNITDFIYSDMLAFDMYSNIRVKCYDERNVREELSEIEYAILSLDYVLVERGLLNAAGQLYLEDFVNGTYLLEIANGSNVYVTDTIVVSSSSNYFEYVLKESVVTSVSQLTLNNALNIYPNPVKETLFVRVDKSFQGNEIVMYDMCGKSVDLSFIPREMGAECALYSVDVASLNNGVYFLKVINEGGNDEKANSVVRFVKH